MRSIICMAMYDSLKSCSIHFHNWFFFNAVVFQGPCVGGVNYVETLSGYLKIHWFSAMRVSCAFTHSLVLIIFLLISRRLYRAVKKQFKIDWSKTFSDIDTNPGLRTYVNLKTNFTIAQYLCLVDDFKFRNAISKLRSSSHNLEKTYAPPHSH